MENQAIPHLAFSESIFTGSVERKASVRAIMTGYFQEVEKIVLEGQRAGGAWILSGTPKYQYKCIVEPSRAGREETVRHRVCTSNCHYTEAGREVEKTYHAGGCFFVMEGRRIVEIRGEKEEVGPNTLIDSPAKIPHCWYNEGDTNLHVLVVKVPRASSLLRCLA